MGGRWTRWLGGSVSAAAVLMGLVGLLAAPAAAAPTAGEVYLVHGILGRTVTVLVDGAAVRTDVAAKSVVGPLTLAPGQHVVEFTDGPASVVSARFSVAAGDNLDVVAHRAADQAMTTVITVFRNDVSAVAPGKTRLVVSHVAVAPPADIRVDGKPFFRNVANGESLSLVVPAKAYTVDVVPTVGGAAILDPVRLELQPGRLTRVFAVGNAADRTTDVIVQNLSVTVSGARSPDSVHTGDGGQAAEELVGTTGSLWTVLGVALAVAGAGLLGSARGSARSAQLVRSRRSR